MEKKQEERRREEHEKIQKEERSSGRKGCRRARARGRPQPQLTAAVLGSSRHRPVASAVLWSGWSLRPASSSSFHLSFLPPCIPTSPQASLHHLAWIWHHPSSGTTAVLKESRRSPRSLQSGIFLCAQPCRLRATAWTVTYKAPLPVLGILQARMLEWIAGPSPGESSQPRDRTHTSYVTSTGRWLLHHQRPLGSPSEPRVRLTFGFAPSNAELDLLSRLVPVSSSLPTPSYLALPSMRHHCLAVGRRAPNTTSLSLGFLICKMGTAPFTSEG